MTSSNAVDRGRHRQQQGAHHSRCCRRAGLPVPRVSSRCARSRTRSGWRTGSATLSSQAAGRQPRSWRHASTYATTATYARRFDVAKSRVPQRLDHRRDATSPARDYRCLVIDGKIAAIAERVPAHVIGDGVLTISELVDIDERRPAPRRRPREGADPDQGRSRPRVELVASQGFAHGRRTARRAR